MCDEAGCVEGPCGGGMRLFTLRTVALTAVFFLVQLAVLNHLLPSTPQTKLQQHHHHHHEQKHTSTLGVGDGRTQPTARLATVLVSSTHTTTTATVTTATTMTAAPPPYLRAFDYQQGLSASVYATLRNTDFGGLWATGSPGSLSLHDYEHAMDDDDVAHLMRTFKTCALVGGSGALLGQRKGAEIDRHEAVLRINAAPSIGYEADVGAKTTIRLLNSKRVYFREREGELVVLSPDSKHTKPRFVRVKAATRRQLEAGTVPVGDDKGVPDTRAAHSRWFILGDEYMSNEQKLQGLLGGALNTAGNNCKPTTGLVAAAYLAEVCHTVNTYGLDPADVQRARKAKQKVPWPYHYYPDDGTIPPVDKTPHCFEQEATAICNAQTKTGKRFTCWRRKHS
eukprot:m.27810 g.27810  ORF g.27810 m.27810 type:complete len:395 (+) comp8646_c0_seq1:181-1365(+)